MHARPLARPVRRLAAGLVLPLALLAGPALSTPALAAPQPAAAGDVAKPESPGNPPLPFYPNLPPQPNRSALAAVSTTPLPCDNNGSDRNMSRAQALTRARSWLSVGIPYSQNRCYRNQYGDYRTDCSGFVSMAWGLGGSGSAFWTGNLMDRAYSISRGSLKQGDALLRHTGDPDENHVALFVRWADSAHTQPVVIEQTGSRDTVQSTWSQSYAGQYNPIRYDNIVDDERPAAPALAYDQGDGSMRIYRWSSTGDEFDRASDYDSGAFTLSSVDDRTASGDVDGDGDSDIVMAYQNTDGTWALHVFRNGNSWAGTWYTGGNMNLDRVAGRLVLGDYNGDGRAEPALVYDQGDGTMRIYRWTSTGTTFNRATDYESGAFSLANVDDRVAAGDVDGDGKDDIVMAYQNDTNSWTLHTFRNGSSWSGVWYTGGTMNLDRVDGRLVLGNW
ncbi:FG-GAP-like repeat-containing protein [Pseudosporangium ferrugineum]|uniref:VCBS repeat protein n=1 Tax=Pseudosporangium ferrugineum TaxID=439699 RepID=A0A2T0SAP7_9ACTN|nr:FG-GAP-like repeat-containing protein [Pseudosporangium ferrugineum]PRY30482.1 VCBS repeat protein [Pseudosporangium ferrugineum]